MSNAITINPHDLRYLVREAVNEAISPWLTMDDMMKKLGIKSTKTIAAMEQRGDIPVRSKAGVWLRSEVNDWLRSHKIAA